MLNAVLPFGGPTDNAFTPTPDDPDGPNALNAVVRGSSEDPWLDNYEPRARTVGMSAPTAYDRLYEYLASRNNSELWDIIHDMSVHDKRQCGSLVVNERKRLKVNRLLLHASLQVAFGTSFDSLFHPGYATPSHV